MIRLIILINFLFLNSICSSLYINEGDASKGLLLLHVVHRHGERSRDVVTYPNDPYYNDNFYPIGPGQLTNAGKRREYDIGTSLRKRYDSFLGNVLLPDYLDVRSTDVNRTKVSALLSSAGLYPPKQEVVWNFLFNWSPLPYNYVKPNKDYVLGYPTIYCPKYSALWSEFGSSNEGLKIFEEDAELFEYISKYSGWNEVTPADIYTLYFSLKTEEEWGLPLPSWVEPIWEEKLKNATIKYYTLCTGTTELKKLSGGFFIKKILEDSINKVGKTLSPSDRKVFLYSGHEYNIAHILRTLDIFPDILPNYGSHIIFEVREVNNIYGITILLQNYDGILSKPKLLTLPGCQEFCPLDKFAEIVSHILPKGESDCDL